MEQIAALLRIAGTVARNPRALRLVLNDETPYREACRKHGFPAGLPQVDLLDLFPSFNVTVRPYSFLDGTSSVLDIALLVALAQRFEACRYLEIGTWRGESVANVAAHARECVSVSLSTDEMRAMGESEDFVRIHHFYSRDLPNVRHIGHNSRTFDFSSLGEGFDLVFVDGDHTHDGVRADTRSAFSVLRGADSVIVWHDYGHSLEAVRWEVLAAILEGCPAERRGGLYHVSNTMCAVWLPGSYRSRMTAFPAVPDKRFNVTLTATRI